MAVSINWGSFKRCLGLFVKGLGFIQGRFRIDPCKKYMTASITYGVLFVSFLLSKSHAIQFQF